MVILNQISFSETPQLKSVSHLKAQSLTTRETYKMITHRPIQVSRTFISAGTFILFLQQHLSIKISFLHYFSSILFGLIKKIKINIHRFQNVRFLLIRLTTVFTQTAVPKEKTTLSPCFPLFITPPFGNHCNESSLSSQCPDRVITMTSRTHHNELGQSL